MTKNNIGVYRNRNSSLRYHLNQNKFVWKYISTVLALYDKIHLFLVLFRSYFCWHILHSYFPFFTSITIFKTVPFDSTYVYGCTRESKLLAEDEAHFWIYINLSCTNNYCVNNYCVFSQFLFSTVSLAYIY